VGNKEGEPLGSDIQGLSADLLEAARRRNLSGNSRTAYERIWTRFLAWAAAASLDPRSLPFPIALEAYRFLGEGKNAASLKQIRAALSFAYKHWDLKNPFAKIEPPLHKEPQIRYLLLSDIRRLLDYLKVRQQGYGSALAFHLANALFQTAGRFEELIQLTWSDCQRVGEKIVALRIKGKGSVFQDVPVPGRLSAALLEWKGTQEGFKGRRILAPGGINFAASQFVFAGYSGEPFSNRAFNLRLRATCRALGVGEITAVAP
jgi:integrase